jgi:hypothetical protein
MNQIIIDMVLLQIKIDIKNQDLTAIEELLKNIPVSDLKNYLSEEYQK